MHSVALARSALAAARNRERRQGQGQAAGGFKVCRKCGATLEASAFNKDNSKADGLRAACKSCRCRLQFCRHLRLPSHGDDP